MNSSTETGRKSSAVGDAFGNLCVYYGFEGDRKLLAVYESIVFSKYPAADVVEACTAFLADPEPLPRMPSPGQIAARIQKKYALAKYVAFKAENDRLNALDKAEGWDRFGAARHLKDLKKWALEKAYPPERLASWFLEWCVRPSRRRSAAEQAVKEGRISAAERDRIIANLDAEIVRKAARGKRIVEVDASAEDVRALN